MSHAENPEITRDFVGADTRQRVEMKDPTDLIMNPETGYYLYPVKPDQLPACETEYPRKYTVKAFTTEEIQDYQYQRSIRGYSLSRPSKGEVTVLLDDGSTKTVQGWIPSESGLIFRSMAIGIYKEKEWSVVELKSGISLMPDEKIETESADQLSFAFASQPRKAPKATGKTRDKAIQLAQDHVSTFTDQQWIDMYERVNYDLAGIDYTPIRTPEQERIENEWGDKFDAVHEANEWIRKTQNFLRFYSKLRVHKNAAIRPKMVKCHELMRIAEKADPKKKTKFYYGQKEHGSSIEVEGVILAIDIEGLPEMKELVLVKGSQFNNTPASKYHTGQQYYVYEPYTGSAVTANINGRTSLKQTVENITEYFMIRLEPVNIEKINLMFQEHREKIIAAQAGEKVERFIEQEK